MLKFAALLAASLLVSAAPVLAAPAAVERNPIQKDTRVLAGQLLIKPADKAVSAATVAAQLSRTLGQSFRVKRDNVVLGWILLEDPSLQSEDATLAVVARAEKLPGIDGAAAVWVWRAFATPGDPFFEFMWHLDAIGARAAWDITEGRSENLVGVVDTGTLFNHEDFVGKNAAQFDFISNVESAADGNGRDGDATDPGDAAPGCAPVNSFHGTHVAGTILANSDNNVGISGLNWNGRLVTGRALGRCGGSTVDINEAVAWMAGFQVDPAPNLSAALRPRVINLSLGATGAPCDSFTNDVWGAVTARGHVIVVAAGNDGNNVPVASPANCPDSVAVAAFGPVNGISLAPYSNFGNEIDIVAPGGDQRFDFNDGVLSAVDSSVSPFQGSIPYSFYEGTSMAAPHVAGVLSLMFDVNPNLSRDQAVDLLKSNSGSCATCRNKPTLRADLAVAAAAGTTISTDPGDSCAGTGFCSPGQVCLGTQDPVCERTCGGDGDCGGGTCQNSICVGGEGEGEGEGGEGEGEPDVGECDVRRGNMDCPVGEGCVEGDDDKGECVRGRDGPGKNGELCEFNRDCGSGLCDRGVCTVTCDGSRCSDGYSCDEDDEDIPGGLCRADSCVDDTAICGDDGFNCSYSSAERYVCAAGPSNYLGFCGAAPGAAAPVAGLMVLLWRRRRRGSRAADR